MTSRHPDVPFGGWPEIQFPGWLADFGFEDQSWINDVSAHAVLLLDQQERGFPQLECWVAEDLPEDREEPKTQPKYRVLAFLTRANGDGEPDEVVHAGENPEDARRAIAAWLAAR